MTLHVLRWSIVSLVGVGLCMNTGCTRSIEVKSGATEAQAAITHSIPSGERVPFVMNSFQLSRNGAPQNPSSDAERRILNRVQETNLFSPVVPLGGQSDTLGEKIVSARFTMDETMEPHSWLSAFKGIIIGGSMFLLSPLINFDYDYSATVGLELERWDGQVTRYEANSSGTVQYKLFSATPVMIDELKGHVTEACLTELTAQVVRDTAQYMASSAPTTQSGIRTVTVKARKPSTIQPTLSVVPTATHKP